MRTNSSKTLLILLSILLSFTFFTAISTKVRAAEPSIEIKNIRHWSNPEYTRIVIDLSGKAEYYDHLLKKDPSINIPFRRLYIDLRNTRLSKDLARKIPIDDGLLKAVRTGQNKEDVARVVLDIESIEDYKIFALGNPFRIIIDVTGQGFSKPTTETAKTFISKTEDKKPEEKPDKKAVTTKSYKIKRIVIDPGHGGKDPGAIGKRKLREKDVTLKVSKLLKKKLEQKMKAKILLTRDRDVYIPLEERTAIANTKGADLFISVHVNASPRKSASGVETYFLDVANDKRAMQVAARENAASAESMDDLQFILRDLIRTANRNDSSRLATSVQNHLVRTLKKRYKGINGYGVKGAPFYVLVRTNMPSILVEVSFISNPTEEKRLRSDKYLNQIASGIADGILSFVNGKEALASNK